MDKINVTRSSLPPYEEYCAEIRDMWDNRWLTNMGEKHRGFQAELAGYLDEDNIELLTNGHMALELTLQALKLSGEVITTPFTFASTTHALVRCGLEPVFCDVDPADFTMNASKIEPLITEKTSALLPVHVYGNICEVEAIQEIANKYNLKVIYDAAHTFGVKYKGRGIGNFGDASCFSFHATKVFHTIEGGAVAYKDAFLGRELARLRNFGLEGQEDAVEVGSNAKLDEFRAAMGLCNLRHIDEVIAKRRRVAERYRERLENIPGVQLGPIQPEVTPNFAYFPVVFDEGIFGAGRDKILSALENEDIHARKYFYPLTSELSCYQGRFNPDRTPLAKWISQRVITLPLYPDLPVEAADKICDIIVSCEK